MDHDPPPDIAPLWLAALRTGLRIAAVLALVFVIKLGMDALAARIALLEGESAARTMTGLMVTILIGYALLIALPFVPGVEIGVAVLMIQGASAAPFVYAATLTGMVIAFLVGRYISLNWLIRICEDLYLFRICTLLQRIRTTPLPDRLATLNDRLPRWLAPILVHYRYVTLALLINMPGNIALGGGGGIMLGAGISRLFRTGYTIVATAIATLPVPLAVWLLGTDVLH